MNKVTIEGQLRSELGKAGSRNIRSEDKVPGVIYGGAQTVNFTATQKDLKPLVFSPNFQLAEVKVDGKTYTCILKDLQLHKVTDKLIHVDLLELVDNKILLANIPLKFTGQSVGVKAGGRFVPKLKTVKVKCLPKYLTESIEVPIDTLEIGKNLRIEDIKAEGISFMQNSRIPIASVVTTRALKQAEAEAAKDGKK
jgi:large subunit ribosomal protein L25